MEDKFFVSRTSCPVCLSKDFTAILQIPFTDALLKVCLDRYVQDTLRSLGVYDIDYSVLLCPECHLFFQKNILSPEGSRVFYSEAVPQVETRHIDFGIGAIPHTADLASSVFLLFRYLRKNPYELRVYEYGMGWGRWCMFMQAFGCEVRCWDISEDRNAYMRNRGFMVQAIEDLPNTFFDIINLDNVLEHVADPRQLLSRLAKALKPTGMMMISVPNPWRLRKLWRQTDLRSLFHNPKFYSLVHPLEHINTFDYRSLTTLVALVDLFRLKLSIIDQYACKTYHVGTRRIARNVLGPVYSAITNRYSSYVFTRRNG